jgi:hypothetical protein
LTRVKVQIEGELLGKLSGGLEDVVFEDGPMVATQTNRVDSVGAMHRWVELAPSVMMVCGLGPFFILRSVNLRCSLNEKWTYFEEIWE